MSSVVISTLLASERTPSIGFVLAAAVMLCLAAHPAEAQLSDGDIVVTSGPGPMRVDPVTGAVSIAYLGPPLFSLPFGMALTGGALVAINYPTNAVPDTGVFSIDAHTGLQSQLTAASPLRQLDTPFNEQLPRALTLAVHADGRIWVPDPGGVLQFDPVNGCFEAVPPPRLAVVDPGSGAIEWFPIPSSWCEGQFGFVKPRALAFADETSLYVADSTDGLIMTGPGHLIRFDLDSLETDVVCGTGSLLPDVRGHMTGIALDAMGRVLLSELEPTSSTEAFGRIVRLDPVTCVEEVVGLGGLLVAPSAIALEASGHLIVVDRAALTDLPDGRVIRIDPDGFDPDNPSANQELLAESSLLTDPRSVIVVPEPGSRTSAAVGMLLLIAYCIGNRGLRVRSPLGRRGRSDQAPTSVMPT